MKEERENKQTKKVWGGKVWASKLESRGVLRCLGLVKIDSWGFPCPLCSQTHPLLDLCWTKAWQALDKAAQGTGGITIPASDQWMRHLGMWFSSGGMAGLSDFEGSSIVKSYISGGNVSWGGCWGDLQWSWHREEEDKPVKRLRIYLSCLSGGTPQDRCLKGESIKISFTTFNEKHFSLLPFPKTVFTKMSVSNGLLGFLGSLWIYWRAEKSIFHRENSKPLLSLGKQ